MKTLILESLALARTRTRTRTRTLERDVNFFSFFSIPYILEQLELTGFIVGELLIGGILHAIDVDKCIDVWGSYREIVLERKQIVKKGKDTRISLHK